MLLLWRLPILYVDGFREDYAVVLRTSPRLVVPVSRPVDRSLRRAMAFTLVELLATISIIVLLVALLIPAAGKVKMKGLEAKGVGNLRQVGLAVMGFANDNKLSLPGPIPLGIVPYYNKKGAATSYAFGAKIAPYLGLPDSGPTRDDFIDVPVLEDPGFADVVKNPPLNTPTFIQNPVLSDRPGVAGKVHILGIQSSTAPQAALTLHDVSNLGGPSKVWMLTTVDQQLPSSVTNKSGWVPNLPATPPYGEVRLRLFVDGHVETVPLDASLP